jgi:putative oxidoreductase
MNRLIHSKAVLWTLTILPAIALFQAGAGKLIHRLVWVENFERWGYPGWFWLAVGALEVISGIALLVPRAASAAAIVLAVTMVWALATFLHAGEATRMLGPLVVLPFLCSVAYLRRSGMFPILSALGLKNTI